MSKASVEIIASSSSWIEQSAVDQLNQNAQLEGIERAVGLPDLHAGRGIAVGAAFWSRTHVYPHLVGNDIGCGMGLWQTDQTLRRFKPDAAEKRLTGLEAAWDGDYRAVLAEAGLPESLMGEALGSIGGGNHFAELLCLEDIEDEAKFDALSLTREHVYLMVHSGSRGLGNAILLRHLDSQAVQPLIAGTDRCASYLQDHDQAVGWAVLNRQVIAVRFFERLGMLGRRALDICHNCVTAHADGWLHRKGAAPADKGVIVVPGSRGDLTYIVQPRLDAGDRALTSLAHGAGRKWSRSEARAKLDRRFSIADLQRTKLGSRVICEDRELIYEEAPQAYKAIHQVIHDLQHAGLIDVVATVRPLITYKTRRE
ncbi:MAG: RNA ligase RtcB family protein [Micropepsaceae bacterium]